MFTWDLTAATRSYGRESAGVRRGSLGREQTLQRRVRSNAGPFSCLICDLRGRLRLFRSMNISQPLHDLLKCQADDAPLDCPGN
jgi:hypothetical protein